MRKISSNMIIILLLLQLFTYVMPIYDILQFRALSHQDHLSAQFANQKAFLEAVAKANSTIDG